MALQFLHDIQGNKTGVFIPIEDWQSLTSKYTELQINEFEFNAELQVWQKEILDERLADYYQNPTKVFDFNQTIENGRKKI